MIKIAIDIDKVREYNLIEIVITKRGGNYHVTNFLLRKERIRKGITQHELSRKSGVKQSIISNIETGDTKNPRLDTAMRLAAALGCKLDDLVEETGEKDKESGRMFK